MTLREEIEKILKKDNIEITWGEVVDGDLGKIITQLLSLIKKHERDLINGIGEDLELWFDRHDRTSKKFQSEDLIKFLKERSNHE